MPKEDEFDWISAAILGIGGLATAFLLSMNPGNNNSSNNNTLPPPPPPSTKPSSGCGCGK